MKHFSAAAADETVSRPPVVCAVLMPHAPILVPEVGGGRGGAAAASARAMRELAATVVGFQPEAVVVISPHAPRQHRAFGLWAEEHLQGSFAQFGAPHAQVRLPNAGRLAQAIIAEAQSRNVATWEIHQRSLDHGALVPLWFLAQAGWAGPTVVLSLDYPAEGGLNEMGEAIAAAAGALQQRIVVVASGDMSHRLTPGAPCGFHSRARLFDEAFIQAVRAGDYPGLQRLDPGLRELAAEDAVDATVVAAAAVNWRATGHRVLNYEGPFGVGYGVAMLFAAAPAPAGNVLPALARESVAAALRGSAESPPPPTGEYLRAARGVFVTVRHRAGGSRGCVGTVRPVCANLVAETWRTARLAALGDTRFPPVQAGQLSQLRFGVSVLHALEETASPDELDPARYGVVVSTADGRCGVLLPGIAEITTVEEQLAIARGKGGIGPHEPVTVRRFEVDHFAEPVETGS